MMDFLLDYLKKHKNASYADVKEAGAKKRFTVYPISYGRAKALLGYIKQSPRGSKSAAAARPAAKRGPGRPRKNAAAPAPAPARRKRVTGTDSLDSIVDTVKALEQERDTYREALVRLRDVLDQALS